METRACQSAFSDFTGGASPYGRATVSLFSPPRDVVSTVNYNIRVTLVLASAIVAATAAALSTPLDPAGTAAYAQTQGLTEIKIGALLEYGPSYDDTSSQRAMELSLQDINGDPAISTKYSVTLVPLDVTGLDSTGISGVVQNAV